MAMARLRRRIQKVSSVAQQSALRLYTSPEKLTLRASSRLDHIYQCIVCKGYCLCNHHNSDPKSVKKVPNVFQNI